MYPRSVGHDGKTVSQIRVLFRVVILFSFLWRSQSRNHRLGWSDHRIKCSNHRIHRDDQIQQYNKSVYIRTSELWNYGLKSFEECQFKFFCRSASIHVLDFLACQNSLPTMLSEYIKAMNSNDYLQHKMIWVLLSGLFFNLSQGILFKILNNFIKLFIKKVSF